MADLFGLSLKSCNGCFYFALGLKDGSDKALNGPSCERLDNFWLGLLSKATFRVSIQHFSQPLKNVCERESLIKNQIHWLVQIIHFFLIENN